MKKKIVWLSMLILCLSFCRVVIAEVNQTQQNHVDQFDQIAEKLDLSVEQKAKIKAIREHTLESLKPKFIQVRAIHEHLNNLAMASKLDEAKVNHLVSQEKEILGDIVKTRVIERHDITSLMTPEQKGRFATMIKDWENRIKSAHRA